VYLDASNGDLYIALRASCIIELRCFAGISFGWDNAQQPCHYFFKLECSYYQVHCVIYISEFECLDEEGDNVLLFVGSKV
jgi:hypothetical protein